MPITSANLQKAIPQTPEDKFNLAANALLDKHIDAICNAVKTDLADKNYEKIKQVARHGDPVLKQSDRLRLIEAAGDQRAQREIPGAHTVLTQIMGEFAKSGLAQSAQNPSGLVPSEVLKNLEAQIETDIRTAVKNTFKQTYQSLAAVEKQQEAKLQAQREVDKQHVEKKVDFLKSMTEKLVVLGLSVLQ